MGRREQPVKPGPLSAFAQDLRSLRAATGLPYRALARKAGYSASALSAAASGQALPTLALTLAFVGACGGDEGQWRQRWHQLAESLRTTNAELLPPDTAGSDQSAPAPSESSQGDHTDPPASAFDEERERVVRQDPARGHFAPLRPNDPTRIGVLPVVARLGGGAMAQVYLARQRDGSPAAVKVVRPDLAEDQEFRRRFSRELRILRQLRGPGVAPVLDADAEAEQPWLATPYVPACTLQEAVELAGPLPAPVVWRIAADLALALTTIHTAGVVHRDLSPANVLISGSGATVIDFGIAHAAAATTLTATGAHLGTAQYMAPEQANGDAVVPATDVFSLGSLLAYAATGSPPFGNDGTTAVLFRIVSEKPDLTALRGLDNNLASLVADCLDKDPDKRPTLDVVLHRILTERPQVGRQGSQWLTPPVVDLLAHREAGMVVALATGRRRRAGRAKALSSTGNGRWPLMVGVPALILIAAAVVSAIILYAGSGTTVDSGVLPPHVTRSAAATPTIDTSLASTIATSATEQTATSAPVRTPSSTQPSVNTPRAAPAVPVTPALLGAPDFNGYCLATGQGPVQLIRNDGYGWHCSADNGTGDDVNAVCAWTFHTSQITNRIADFSNPNSWQCWRATHKLGPLDFNAYCRALGYPGATYIDGRDAYGWYCTNSGNGLDAQDACRRLYRSNPPISRFQNFYDQNSWECWQ